MTALGSSIITVWEYTAVVFGIKFSRPEVAHVPAEMAEHKARMEDERRRYIKE